MNVWGQGRLFGGSPLSFLTPIQCVFKVGILKFPAREPNEPKDETLKSVTLDVPSCEEINILEPLLES